MNEAEKQSFVTAWIDAQIAFDHRQKEPLHWAIDAFMRYPYDDPDLAWELIQRVLSADEAGRVRDILAAGPLEDLMSAHGPHFIDRVEALAQSDAAFKDLMAGVWLSNSDTPICDRFYRAAGIEQPFRERAE